MIEQGIDEDDISVYNDDGGKGCLTSFLISFRELTADGGTWHLQDDVIISSDFKEKTEKYDNGIVCGFCNSYSNSRTWGYTDLMNMWYSFPCIRIPNRIAVTFTHWCDYLGDRYYYYRKDNKHVDVLFREYLYSKYPDMTVLNLAPNIVNHVDYLLGGSIINVERIQDVGSLFWEEPDLIDELRYKIGFDKHSI